MEFLLNRYRNLSALLAVILVQLVLIAYQVKSNKDVPLVRAWAVTVVSPVERSLEFLRRNTIGAVHDYFVLVGARSENERLKGELNKAKLENQYLRTELSSADRVKALAAFQAHTQSKTLAARIIANGTGANSKVVFIDRGSVAGVESGMAVITPEGIVGKVVAAYPTASSVLLITDANFAAGVMSQRNRVRGTLKGLGHEGSVFVDYVQNDEKVELGEWFFTSGDDRIFPKGSPVGRVTAVHNGQTTKEIYLSPSGFQGGLEEVLVVLKGVHEDIPDDEPAAPAYKLLPPPVEKAVAGEPSSGAPNTEADRLKAQYQKLGEEEKHVFGQGTPGSIPPDFTKLQDPRRAAAAKPATPKPGTDPSAQTAPGGPATPATVGPGSKLPATAKNTPATAAAAKPPGANSSPVVTATAAPVKAGAAQPAGKPLSKPGQAPAANSGSGAVATAAMPVKAGTAQPGGKPLSKPGQPPITAAAAPGSKAAPNRAAASLTDAGSPAAPPRRRTGPLLVTDPTDADPTEPLPVRRPAGLDEFGQPRSRAGAVGDNNTDILPAAPPPKSKRPQSDASKGFVARPPNARPTGPPRNP